MRYVSTRGGMAPATFTDVLLDGLAPDGGLVVPERVPSIDLPDLSGLRQAPYEEVALAVVSRFADDIARDDLGAMISSAYSRTVFTHPDVVSLRQLGDGVHLAGLAHGPTLAFKDMAMQLLGRMFDWVLAERSEHLTVLGATSGDTGSSAEHALAGSDHVDVFMLSPLGRTTPFQAAQMYTVYADNVHNLVVRGVFDDCQDLVKAVNADATFKAAHHIGAVNSINWARIVAQTAYYVFAYLRVAPDIGAEVSFAVPTGNFGNVYAGYVARRMGIPIRRLVVACNENDVLDEFFRTGRYTVRRAADVAATSSPSMDIAKASNFERYVYDLLDHDAELTAELFARVDAGGGFDMSGQPALRRVGATGLASGTSGHADRVATIRRLHADHGIVVDPHTADGVTVGLRHLDAGVPMICLETAQPAKFADTIVEALGFAPPVPAGWEDLLDRPQRFDVIEPDVAAVKNTIDAHRRS